MRQTSQISKFTSLRAGFAALSIFALIGVSGLAIANDAAPAAAAALKQSLQYQASLKSILQQVRHCIPMGMQVAE